MSLLCYCFFVDSFYCFSTVGTKKTLWVNFQEICAMMRRSSDHVFQFMMAELGTEGSIDGNKRLVIRGKFVPKVCVFLAVILSRSFIDSSLLSHYLVACSTSSRYCANILVSTW